MTNTETNSVELLSREGLDVVWEAANQALHACDAANAMAALETLLVQARARNVHPDELTCPTALGKLYPTVAQRVQLFNVYPRWK